LWKNFLEIIKNYSAIFLYMDIDKLKELAEIMKEHPGMELTLESGEEKITIKSGNNKKPKITGSSIGKEIIENEEIDNEKLYSPYVGFVKFGEKGKNYVNEGDVVKKGTLLCKVEPFGREIRAEYKLKILQTLEIGLQEFYDGIVEYGSPLFSIEKLSE